MEKASSQSDAGGRPVPGAAGPFTLAVLLLFMGSGCAALIYEVVWFQLLRFVIGASAVSLGILLASFMGGMCLGSLGYAHLVSARHHPLRVYAVLELGIAAIGMALPLVLPRLGGYYVSHAESGWSGVGLRAMVAGVSLLPPTILMGATLPAIGRWVRSTPAGASQLGFFYGANIVGAVAGCLLAGFYLLPFHDKSVATYTAVALNLAVAFVALALSSRLSYAPEQPTPAGRAAGRAVKTVYVVIALSGFTALGAEVVWTRLLSLQFGVTVYTFSIILAVFLAGLGIGSAIGSGLVRRLRRPALALAVCQMLLVFAIAYAAYMITRQIPYWDRPLRGPEAMMATFMTDVTRAAVAMLPATVLWGASFPLALAGCGLTGRDPGRTVGGLYAANTIGAILGAMVFSLVAIPDWGSRAAQQTLVLVAGAAALAMAFGLWIRAEASRKPRTPSAALAAAALALTLTLVTVFLVPSTPAELFVHGRFVSRPDYAKEFRYHDGRTLSVDEGLHTSVAVWEYQGRKSLHLAGKTVASDWKIDMWLQRTLGHLPALIHPRPRSVLVVGLGAGVTAGAFVVHPEVERIVICEIEPRVANAAQGFFGRANHHVLTDPRTELVFDDGRHFLATTREKFDVITSDPIHPFVRGAAALYSTEYFGLVREHLNPGGIVTQWIPLYETNEAAVKSQLATLFRAFPYGTIWHSTLTRVGFDIVFLGRQEPLRVDADAMHQRIARNVALQRSLGEVGVASVVPLLQSYAGRGSDLADWLRDAQINRDVNLRLEYLAGLAQDISAGEAILSGMLRYRQYPDDVFVASDGLEQALRGGFD